MTGKGNQQTLKHTLLSACLELQGKHTELGIDNLPEEIAVKKKRNLIIFPS